MKKLLVCLAALLFTSTAQAQQTAPLYCNAAAVYDTAVVGTTKLVSAPTVGGIFVCGFSLASVATTTFAAKLTYSTVGVVNSSGLGGNVLVTQALQNTLTPAWQFISPTTGQYLVDHPGVYNGIFVPNGNQLNITTSVGTGSLQAIIYYWTQNP